jgi:glycosyltransferase involved in cell wall biosynthesis
MTAGAPPLISVIIPTLNEERVIARCLESLSQNRFPRDQFEVIVIDNGSKDRTIDVAKGFAATLSLRVFEHEGVYISALRNRGVAAARGEIFAFLDADCLAPRAWLQNVQLFAEKADAGVLGAHYEVPSDATWVGRVWSRDRSRGKDGTVSYVPAGDLIIRRKLFERVGGFDESIQTNEDYELCQRVIEAGLSVKAEPSLGVVHLGTPRTVREFFRKQRWHGTSVLKVFMRDPNRRKNRRVVLVSVYTLACILGVLLGLIWAMATVNLVICILFVILILIPPFAIASTRSFRSKEWKSIPALALLYLIFFVARASSLLGFRIWSQRASKP